MSMPLRWVYWTFPITAVAATSCSLLFNADLLGQGDSTAVGGSDSTTASGVGGNSSSDGGSDLGGTFNSVLCTSSDEVFDLLMPEETNSITLESLRLIPDAPYAHMVVNDKANKRLLVRTFNSEDGTVSELVSWDYGDLSIVVGDGVRIPVQNVLSVNGAFPNPGRLSFAIDSEEGVVTGEASDPIDYGSSPECQDKSLENIQMSPDLTSIYYMGTCSISEANSSLFLGTYDGETGQATEIVEPPAAEPKLVSFSHVSDGSTPSYLAMFGNPESSLFRSGIAEELVDPRTFAFNNASSEKTGSYFPLGATVVRKVGEPPSAVTVFIAHQPPDGVVKVFSGSLSESDFIRLADSSGLSLMSAVTEYSTPARIGTWSHPSSASATIFFSTLTSDGLFLHWFSEAGQMIIMDHPVNEVDSSMREYVESSVAHVAGNKAFIAWIETNGDTPQIIGRMVECSLPE